MIEATTFDNITEYIQFPSGIHLYSQLLQQNMHYFPSFESKNN